MQKMACTCTVHEDATAVFTQGPLNSVDASLGVDGDVDTNNIERLQWCLGEQQNSN